MGDSFKFFGHLEALITSIIMASAKLTPKSLTIISILAIHDITSYVLHKTKLVFFEKNTDAIISHQRDVRKFRTQNKWKLQLPTSKLCVFYKKD